MWFFRDCFDVNMFLYILYMQVCENEEVWVGELFEFLLLLLLEEVIDIEGIGFCVVGNVVFLVVFKILDYKVEKFGILVDESNLMYKGFVSYCEVEF